MYCRNCGYELADGAKFCRNCGGKVSAAAGRAAKEEGNASERRPIVCAVCGAPLREGAKFCRSCGQAVQTNGPVNGNMRPGANGMPGNGNMGPGANGMPGNGNMGPGVNGMPGNGNMRPGANGMPGNGNMRPGVNGMPGNGNMGPGVNGMPGNGNMRSGANGMPANGNMRPGTNGMPANGAGAGNGKAVKAGKKEVELIRRILSQLRDNEVQAASAAGEVRMPLSDAQNTFLKLVKKGLLVILLCAFTSSAALPVMASSEDEDNGYWKYVGDEVVGPDSNFEGASMTGGYNHYTCSATCVDEAIMDYHGSKDKRTSCVGEWVEINVELTEPPRGDLHPGDVITITENFSLTSSKYDHSLLFYICQLNVNMGTNIYHNPETYFVNDEGIYFYGIDRTWETDSYNDYAYTGSMFVMPCDNHFSATVPEGYKGQTLWIRTGFGHGRGEDSICTYYYYEWVDPDDMVEAQPTEAAVPLHGDDTDGEDKEENEEEEEEKEDGYKEWIVDKDASNEAGEFPVAIPVGAAIAIIGGGAAAAAAKGKKGKEDPNRYEMRINKDFGDTFYTGEMKPLYARIVKIDPLGNESTELSLTARIRISSPGYLQVGPASMGGGAYMGANVLAPEEETVPEEAVVEFSLAGKGGRFCNRVHFKIMKPRIEFSQDNVSLPALYKEEEPIEFRVIGMDPETTVLEAEFGAQASYQVNLATTDEGAAKGLYMALIKDINKNLGTPGTYDEDLLMVTAKDDKREISAGIYIRRVTEGMYMNLKAVNCYGVLKPDAEKNEDEMYPLDAYQAAETEAQAWALFFETDEEGKGHLVQTSVSPQISFTTTRPQNVEEQTTEEYLEISDERNRIEDLGIKLYVSERKESISTCKLYCTQGFLNSPCRLYVYAEAKAKCTVNGEEKEYSWAGTVLLRSQPRRVARTNEERAVFDQQDKDCDHKLKSIIDYVDDNYLQKELYWVYTQAWYHFNSYEYEYGYDVQAVDMLMFLFRLWYDQNVMAYREREQRLTTNYAQNFGFYEIYNEATGSLPGIGARCLLAFATGGVSEAVMLPLDVMAALKEYDNQTLPEERTTWDKFKAGSVPVLWAAAFQFGPGVAKDLFKGTQRLGGKVLSATGKALKPRVSAIYKKLPAGARVLTEKMGGYLKVTVEKVKALDPRKWFNKWGNYAKEKTQSSRAARERIMDYIKSLRQRGQELDDILTMADDAASLKGWGTVKEFVDEVRNMGTGDDAMGYLKEKILKVMQDPQALEQLNRMSGEAGREMRAVFNHVQKEFIYKPTRARTMELLASRLNKNPSKLRFRNVSSNADEALAVGEKVAHDLDVTVEELVDGKWVPLKQHDVKRVYHEAFCDANNILFTSADDAIRISESYQQHVCQSLEDIEFYPEVEKLLNESRLSESILNIDRVKMTFRYKAQHLFDAGEEICNSFKGERLLNVQAELKRFLRQRKPDGSLLELSEDAKKYLEGVAMQKEGLRSGAKSFKLMDNKDTAAMVKGAGTAISNSAREVAEAAAMTYEHGVSRMTLSEFKSFVKSRNVTYQQAVSMWTQMLGNVNTNLQG